MRYRRWGILVIAIAALCLWLGLPWWLVGGGILFFVAVIIFDT